jgi:hypothetical protein
MTDKDQHHNLHTQGSGPVAERTVLVHKKDAEGALIVNALTGQIAQPIDERPEWSEGLATALLGERLKFWGDRLGPQFTDELKFPQAIAFEDLGWLIVDEDGEVNETEADAEFRMDLLASYHGIDRSAPEGSAESNFSTGRGKVLAEVEIGMDRLRTGDEVSAMEKSQGEGFSEDRKTGTHEG